MNDLKKIREWLATYPGSIPMRLQVDYTAPDPNNGSIDPSGLIEISRKEDVLGNVAVENQLNFTLYFVFLKSPGDDAGATENADLLMDFQRWVQEQSIRKLVPIFGDNPEKETAKAQNGSIYAADEEGTAMYTVQLAINFIKKYEVS